MKIKRYPGKAIANDPSWLEMDIPNSTRGRMYEDNWLDAQRNLSENSSPSNSLNRWDSNGTISRLGKYQNMLQELSRKNPDLETSSKASSTGSVKLKYHSDKYLARINSKNRKDIWNPEEYYLPSQVQLKRQQSFHCPSRPEDDFKRGEDVPMNGYKSLPKPKPRKRLPGVEKDENFENVIDDLEKQIKKSVRFDENKTDIDDHLEGKRKDDGCDDKDVKRGMSRKIRVFVNPLEALDGLIEQSALKSKEVSLQDNIFSLQNNCESGFSAQSQGYPVRNQTKSVQNQTYSAQNEVYDVQNQDHYVENQDRYEQNQTHIVQNQARFDQNHSAQNQIFSVRIPENSSTNNFPSASARNYISSNYNNAFSSSQDLPLSTYNGFSSLTQNHESLFHTNHNFFHPTQNFSSFSSVQAHVVTSPAQIHTSSTSSTQNYASSFSTKNNASFSTNNNRSSPKNISSTSSSSSKGLKTKNILKDDFKTEKNEERLNDWIDDQNKYLTNENDEYHHKFPNPQSDGDGNNLNRNDSGFYEQPKKVRQRIPPRNIYPSSNETSDTDLSFGSSPKSDSDFEEVSKVRKEKKLLKTTSGENRKENNSYSGEKLKGTNYNDHEYLNGTGSNDEQNPNNRVSYVNNGTQYCLESRNILVVGEEEKCPEIEKLNMKISNLARKECSVPKLHQSVDSSDFLIPRPKLIVPVHTYGTRRRRTGNLHGSVCEYNCEVVDSGTNCKKSEVGNGTRGGDGN